LIRLAEATALLHASTGRWDLAADRLDVVRRTTHRRLTEVLPELPLVEQMKFLELEDGWSFHRALSLALARPDDAKVAALSAAWLLNGKSVSQGALGTRLRTARDRNDPKTAAIIEQLGIVRSQLAALAGAGFRSEEGAPQEVFSEMELAERIRTGKSPALAAEASPMSRSS
jgi:hypothetical protein